MGKKNFGEDLGGTKDDLNEKDVRAIKELLHSSWVDIEYKYKGLTATEKKAVDKKTFDRLKKWIGD
jgi:hypothetical protein